ncbi:MAG: class I SAM-dependent methyltransferase [Promethearchaeota archaeon]|nr:MAG: class I SAM-dependent methyltransferase [Candidatus Lokiarchaeota archaeon]
MERNNSHYYSKFPDAKLKIYTVSESLRRHLYIFKTAPGMFSYKKIDLGTKVLIEHLTIPREEPSILLDLGCGYGPIGIVLAYEAPQSKVYLIDINRRAIWCAKDNIKINLSDRTNQIVALAGNYFDPIKNKNLKFDGIYTNPPLRQGREEFLKLCNEIPSYLKPSGYFQFVIKKKMGAPFILKHLSDSFTDKKIDIICKRSGYWVFNIIFD